jgi:hypothetical protein
MKSRISTIEVGKSTALFIDSKNFIERCRQLGLLPPDWQPRQRRSDDAAAS